MYLPLRFLSERRYLAVRRSRSSYLTQKAFRHNGIVEERRGGEHKSGRRRTHTEPPRNLGVTQSYIGERSDTLEQQHVLDV